MSSRRIAISSLLCDDDAPAHTRPDIALHDAREPVPEPVPEPVILAPHLRRPDDRAPRQHHSPPSPFADAGHYRQQPSPRPLVIEPSHGHHSRPSSVASPHFLPPPSLSPSLSPSHRYSPLPPSAPYSRSSPALQRASMSHHPEARRVSAGSHQMFPPQSPASSSRAPTALGGLDILVQAASEERQRLHSHAEEAARISPVGSTSHASSRPHSSYFAEQQFAPVRFMGPGVEPVVRGPSISPSHDYVQRTQQYSHSHSQPSHEPPPYVLSGPAVKHGYQEGPLAHTPRNSPPSPVIPRSSRPSLNDLIEPRPERPSVYQTRPAAAHPSHTAEPSHAHAPPASHHRQPSPPPKPKLRDIPPLVRAPVPAPTPAPVAKADVEPKQEGEDRAPSGVSPTASRKTGRASLSSLLSPADPERGHASIPPAHVGDARADVHASDADTRPAPAAAQMQRSVSSGSQSPSALDVRGSGGMGFAQAMGGRGTADAGPGAVNGRAASRPPRRYPPGSELGRAFAARKSHDQEPASAESQREIAREGPRPPVFAKAEDPARDLLSPKQWEVLSAVADKAAFREDTDDWLFEQLKGDLVGPGKPKTGLKRKASNKEPPAHGKAKEAVKREQDNESTDMDVDLAVSELVEDAFERPKLEGDVDMAMDVDVDDELLSLLDDKPHPAPVKRSQSSASADKHGALSKTKDPAALSATTTFNHSAPSVSDRESMPSEAMSSASAANKRKKPAAKPRAKADPAGAAKPRAKPAAKARPQAGSAASKLAKPAAPAVVTTLSGRKSIPAASRSRSTSVMPPGGPADTEKHEEEAQGLEQEAAKDKDEDKLYCICKTGYDHLRCMIACDKCDEWYHTACVDVPDQEVDLIDQFFCPPCVEKNPQSKLKTTYKQRCLFGLEHPDPSSEKACRKPSRGVFSKYCSDACGLANMRQRIEVWAKKGGRTERLWEDVKHAERREGVVYRVECDASSDPNGAPQKLCPVNLQKRKADREAERLHGVLDGVVKLREELRRGMEVIGLRERLLELAVERAEREGMCGWDQRLCYGDEEWAQFGEGVLESYEHADAPDAMQTEEQEEEWWCPGAKECQRHKGWQTLRQSDLENERSLKEAALAKLTTREREVRRRIEDIVEPSAFRAAVSAPLKAANSNSKLANGHGREKPNGDSRKGKKRKLAA